MNFSVARIMCIFKDSHAQYMPILLLFLFALEFTVAAEACVAEKSGIEDCLLIALNTFWMSF